MVCWLVSLPSCFGPLLSAFLILQPERFFFVCKSEPASSLLKMFSAPSTWILAGCSPLSQAISRWLLPHWTACSLPTLSPVSRHLQPLLARPEITPLTRFSPLQFPLVLLDSASSLVEVFSDHKGCIGCSFCAFAQGPIIALTTPPFLPVSSLFLSLKLQTCRG